MTFTLCWFVGLSITEGKLHLLCFDLCYSLFTEVHAYTTTIEES